MTTITFRARHLNEPFAVGELLCPSLPGAPKKSAVYRVVSVTRVQVSGEPKKNYHRLVCERLSAAHIPVGAVVRHLPHARTPTGTRVTRARRASADPGPPEAAADRLARIRAKAPLFYELAIDAIRRNRVSLEQSQVARAARVGRDDGQREGRDYGPGIRLRPVRGRRQSALLREADVEIVAGPDPARPNATLSRARRCDPLVKLYKAGSIAGRHVDAAEKLREQLEYSEGVSGGAMSEIHVPGHQRQGFSEWQLVNSTRVREAVTAVASLHRPMLLWVVNGGNVSGFASRAHIRHTTAAEYLKAGLAQLADHYRLPGGQAE